MICTNERMEMKDRALNYIKNDETFVSFRSSSITYENMIPYKLIFFFFQILGGNVNLFF